jgi:hypothetical protein
MGGHLLAGFLSGRIPLLRIHRHGELALRLPLLGDVVPMAPFVVEDRFLHPGHRPNDPFIPVHPPLLSLNQGL